MMSGHDSPLCQPMIPDASKSGGIYHNPNDVSIENDTRNFLAQIREMDGERLLRYLRVTNVLLACFQIFVGFTGMFDLLFLNVTSFLTALYTMIFGALLLMFEIRLGTMEPTLRENFGFLFTYKGRTAFIFFVGFMNFGMSSTTAWAAGMLMCANAVFNCYVMMTHPEFAAGKLSADMDPTVAYSSGEQETLSWLGRNPTMASNATSFFLSGGLKKDSQQLYNPPQTSKESWSSPAHIESQAA